MRVRLERTKDGHQLVDLETGTVVFGPNHSLAKLSRFTADNRVSIVDRRDTAIESFGPGDNEKSAVSSKGDGA